MADFLDSSVLARAYLADEPAHALARELAFERAAPVCSELALAEVSVAIARAARGRRISPQLAASLRELLTRDLGGVGPITVLRSDLSALVDRAVELVPDHALRTLDALHLAAAEIDGRRAAGQAELGFATADTAQASAAEALGFHVTLLT